MTQGHTPLVPLADRPFAPPPEQDSEQQTIWHNPTDRAVTLDIFVGTPLPSPGIKPKGIEQRQGVRRYVIGPKETRALPAIYDIAIQHTQCQHTDCLQTPFICKSRDPDHVKVIVGGLGPQLHNKGTQTAPITSPPMLSPALDDVEARRKAAEQEQFRAWQQERMAAEARARAKADEEKATHELAAREMAALEAATAPNPKKK